MIRQSGFIRRGCRVNGMNGFPWVRASVIGLAAALGALTATAGTTPKAAPKVSAPAARPAAKSPTTGSAGHTSSAGHTGNVPTHGKEAGGRPEVSNREHTLKAPPGGSVHETKSGGVVAKNSQGKVTAYKDAKGNEVRFNHEGRVKEVHAKGMTVRPGPGGARRVEVERADHSRVVAYGHGGGYIQHPAYQYGGHSYYARSYYYHGTYYNGYYSGYYYHGSYLYGYRPAYYYPPVYYGWAYNPWPAPVPYAWGWGGAPWYGYYGAYYQPYPVYPSASYWLVDYMVAASLAEAYAASAAAGLRPVNPAHLMYASYDPGTGTTSPTMSKEVKDAVADEIKLELAAGQKTADAAAGTSGTLESLVADGKPHVFVASSPLTVTSSGTDCGLTEGDVLALNTPPSGEATDAELRVLASKQSDCGKGDVVKVELTDLQEMHNHLLSNIDKGMAQMKDHPGQGGLPTPPADAISGTKEAPYAAAAPATDPNGAAELDKTEQEGAQTEKEVVAEAAEPDAAETATSSSPIGGVTSPAPSAPPATRGPQVIALGQTPEQVIAMKGQPTNKVAFPTKTVFIYPDMKITFKNGKLTDVQ